MTNQESLTADFGSATAFQTLAAKLQFANGKAQLRPFTATLSGVRLGGTGEYVLTDKTFDAVFTARLSGDLETHDQACRINKQFLEIDWPVRCKGHLDGDTSDWCGIDRDGLQKIIAQLATSKVKKKVEKELLKGLDKLFGGGNSNDDNSDNESNSNNDGSSNIDGN